MWQKHTFRRHRYRIAWGIGIAIAAGMVWIVGIMFRRSPEDVMYDFYHQPWAAEDQLMDPLILGGDSVVPLVINDIQDPEMPLRRYAIGFLGIGGFETAVPALEVILLDETERDYFRGDAIVALYQIDRELGLELAATYKDREDYLGHMAREVLAETPYVTERRSYLEAKIGAHY